MTSRDAQASYYDLELPDGTRTEVWSVLRAVLTAEEAVGYAKGCLLTRIMRDGRKDVDRLREAEKVAVEAGMLREAMEAYLATPDPLVAALDAVDSHDPRECAARIGDLEHRLAAQQMSYESQQIDHLDRIAALERERDTLKTERQAAVATAEELERVRRKLDDVMDVQSVGAITTYRRVLGARESETLFEAISRVTQDLADLRERYRPRRQSEEPAPDGAPIMRWNATTMRWQPSYGYELRPDHTWTHQPPAPGEVEA